MKKFNFVAVSAAVLFSMLFLVPAYAAEGPQVVAEHLTMAASYETQAAQQDALIAEHTNMKKEYKEKFFVNEKLTPMNKIRKMEEHCNAIIATATKEKSELLEFAKWHQMRAAELQGR